jgi:hypothetical protein
MIHSKTVHGEVFDDVNRETGLPQTDGNSLELPYSYIKDNVKQFYQTGTTYKMVFVECRSNDSYIVFSANNLKLNLLLMEITLKEIAFYLKLVKSW